MHDLRLITTKQHAVIDYAWGTLLPVLPRLLGWNRSATHLVDSVAAVGTVQSLLTDYEGGALPVLPMQAHLAMDGLIGAGLIGVALTDDEQPAAVRATLLGAGVFALMAMALTTPIPTGHGRKTARRVATRVNTLAGPVAAAVAGR